MKECPLFLPSQRQYVQNERQVYDRKYEPSNDHLPSLSVYFPALPSALSRCTSHSLRVSHTHADRSWGLAALHAFPFQFRGQRTRGQLHTKRIHNIVGLHILYPPIVCHELHFQYLNKEPPSWSLINVLLLNQLRRHKKYKRNLHSSHLAKCHNQPRRYRRP